MLIRLAKGLSEHPSFLLWLRNDNNNVDPIRVTGVAMFTIEALSVEWASSISSANLTQNEPLHLFRCPRPLPLPFSSNSPLNSLSELQKKP